MKSSLSTFFILAMFFAQPNCVAQTQPIPVPSPPPAPAATAAARFHYVVDPSLVKESWTYHESGGASHTVALVKDDKGVIREFVEDEVVVRNDPAEVTALVANYHARMVRQITVNGVSAEGKPLPPAKTTPRTVLQIDASSSPLHLENEALKIKAVGTHTFSSAKAANLAAIVAHERAAGHSVQPNFLVRPAQFPTSSKEQPDATGVSDAYQWPEFDHRAWQYVLDAGIKTHPLVAIIDSGFWLNSQGVPCGYEVDSLCQTTAHAVGNSDLPKSSFSQWDATGGSSFAGGANTVPSTGGAISPWHGNMSASVALGKLDNSTGAAGMGGPVASPLLIKVGGPDAEITAAIETAVQRGASIISISSGGNCNYWCQENNLTGDDQDAPLKAYSQGVLVVASAGNNAQDAGANYFWPCYNSLCVGAMNSFTDSNGYFIKMNGIGASYSNFGPSVVIWAPTNIRAMPDQLLGNVTLTIHNGTSASTPYVAGVAALMKAVNPSLTANQIFAILWETGTQIVTSAAPDNKPQNGRLIAPLEAVVFGNHGQAVQPKVVIKSPRDNATVGQQLYKGVTFKAFALDILAGSPPASSAGSQSTGQPTWCAQDTCLPTPFYAADGSLNWPFPTTALSLRLADSSLATTQNGFNWPLPVLSYTAGPIQWTSSDSSDSPIGGAGYSESGGTNFSYVFSPTAHPGNRVIKAIRAALTDIAQALAAGQLDSRTAGKLLYAIQQVSSTNRRIEQMEAAQLEKLKEDKEGVPQIRARLLGDNLGSQAADHSRIQEFPEFEKQFGLPPDADLDAETDAVLRKADEEAELRQSESLPEPPPGVRVGSPAYRVFREEAYQSMQMQLTRMPHQLRDYHQQKRQQYEAAMKKEMMSETPAPDRRADTA